MKRIAILMLVVLMISAYSLAQNPEPSGWYAGDMHVHRSCGGSPVSVSNLFNRMSEQNLAALCLLADMGNGEVQNPTTDLPLVNGRDASFSTSSRILHWDAEWHWDATYSQYAHQALGGHIVALGLTGAHQIWQEYTYPILDWAHQQNAVAGFVHMQYLGDGFPQDLNCCLPMEYPVEVALASADFVSEDVSGGGGSIDAYYKLLNSGFRPGFVAGTDYPCNDGSIGSPLTYVRVADGAFTYRNWIDGVSNGKTVVSLNGHSEFLDLKVNDTAGPGDEVALISGGNIPVTVQWTANTNITGTIELVLNGVVVASKQGPVSSNTPVTLSTAVNITKSGWLAARRMNGGDHVVHTAAVFVIVNKQPIRANASDPQFFVQWISGLLNNTSPGGPWNWYFPTSLSAAQARYSAAKALYQQIALEAQGLGPSLSFITVTPENETMAPGTTQSFTAMGTYSDGSTLNISGQVTWESSDSTIAKVNLRGLTLANNAGTAVISASLGAISGSTSVTVGTPPALSSIAVTPATPTLAAGGTQQFTATGRYSDNSTHEITGQVTWASSNTSVATITSSGLATAVSQGSSSISATLGSISGATTLSVQAAPLAITTAVLPNGFVGLAYSTTLQASGGASPYTWSVSTGSTVPPGIALSAAGQLSGTPTVAGTSNFEIQVRDSAGTTVTKNLSVTIASTPPTGYTLWIAATVPATIDSGPDNAVELGVKFRADLDGSILGVRFYKSSANTGTHVANLWTSGGTKLASATFSGETASGWQQTNFATPVAIKAGTIYVASYHTNTGHYSDDQGYFTGKGVDSPPLHALQDGVSGGNGVYAYGSTSNFPSSTWNTSNYWVDVVFVPSGSDTTPPTIISVNPPAGSSGAAVSSSITATFSEAIDPATVSSNTVQLLDPSNGVVPATVTYNSATNSAVLTPSSGLAYLTTYRAVLKGGTTDPRVKDFSGNPLASDYTWSFTTSAPPPPPPSEGPGGPILVVSSSSNPFSRYYGEILRAEGLNEFTVTDLSIVSGATLSAYDVVILGNLPLSDSQVSMFTDWVNAGGNLIAMRPDKKLAALLGLVDSNSTLAESYLAINTTTGPGVGLVSQTIQFHGTADRYTPGSATTLATLYSSAANSTSSPAVSLNRAGLGQAAAFAYDLARSVVYTRQGNPAWSGQNRDGQSGPIRADNLFFGAASFDPQPDWINLSKVAIPQADEQQRLLANLILKMNQAKRPLPRFWYFPNGHKAAVVLTGDDHGNGRGDTAGHFNTYIAASPSGCSVNAWQCVRATSYLMAPADNPLTNAQAQQYVSNGFEVSVHVDSDPDCSDWTPTALDSFYTNQLEQFAARYTNIPSPKTHRMHCVGWSDFDSQPKVELAHGIRLDTDYYYWPPEWINDTPGIFTGSGMPMRFTDRTGSIIDVYQATTQMTDESGQSYPETINALLDNALGSAGYYGFFTANMHNDSAPSAGADEIIASAQARGVPIISANQLLTWLDGRNGSSFGSLAWNLNTLTFTVSIGAGANSLQVMLPTETASGTLASLTLNGSAVQYTTQTIKGIRYAVFFASVGTFSATYSGSPVVTVTSIVLNPNSVPSNGSSRATVSLSSPAPGLGATVTLASSNSSVAAVPADVTVSAGSTTATFTVNASAVASSTTVTITASYGGADVSAPLTVTPPSAVSSVVLNPTSVIGGSLSTGTVTLTQPAPAGGAVVALSSANPGVASVPATVAVSSGTSTATFSVTTSSVTATTNVAITATYGASQSASLSVIPPGLSAFALNPTSVIGGNSSTGTVTLSGPAPASGSVVTLSSANPSAASVPASVTVPAGATTATFTISTAVGASPTSVGITATYGVSRTATLTITQPAVLSLTLTPRSVVGGSTSTGTVTLTSAAPIGGAAITLSSANPSVASVPASVTVAAGSTTATFTVSTTPVVTATATAITATGGASRTATLTVNPPTLSSLTLSPTAVTGGTSSTGTITLTGAAPATGILVSLLSGNTAIATVSQSVTIPSGSRTATFSVTTYPVGSTASSTISASAGSVTRTATLSVRAPALSSLALNPSTVRGGSTSTGTVTLNGPTATSTVVSLRSSSTYASVPSSVAVAAGSRTATFTITTRTTLSTRRVTIYAVYGSVTRSATLTITQ